MLHIEVAAKPKLYQNHLEAWQLPLRDCLARSSQNADFYDAKNITLAGIASIFVAIFFLKKLQNIGNKKKMKPTRLKS